MSKKTIPLYVSFAVLLFASLACNALGGGSTNNFQATANAAFTQAASGAATAGAQGNAGLATANAASTQAMATANAATGGEPTATTAAGGPAATTAPTGGGPVSGGPADIPVINAQATVQVASDKLLSYITSADIATVVKFYKDAMPKSGWTQNPTMSVETPTASTLAFTKDTRNAIIVVGKANGQTVVAVTVS